MRMQRSIWLRTGISVATALAVLWVGVSAQAATRNMVGSVGAINPSLSPPNIWEVGPYLFGKNGGPYGIDAPPKTISVAGATAGTFVGRQVTLPASRVAFSGTQLRLFPTFPSVGNDCSKWVDPRLQQESLRVESQPN